MALAYLEFTGVVQRVGFRWFVRQQARAFGLAGWVKNEASGAVRVAVKGDAKVVAEFVAAIRRGPSGARVDEVRELPTDAIGELPDTFIVMR